MNKDTPGARYSDAMQPSPLCMLAIDRTGVSAFFDLAEAAEHVASAIECRG
jgi:hypothetical protein